MQKWGTYNQVLPQNIWGAIGCCTFGRQSGRFLEHGWERRFMLKGKILSHEHGEILCLFANMREAT